MFTRWLGAGALALVASGCLSPAALRPVAEQNSVNVRNLSANVAKLAAALESEVAFHAGLEAEMARVALSQALIKLPTKWTGSANPTAADLADLTKDPQKAMVAESKQARTRLAQLRAGRVEDTTMLAKLAADFPLTADIALGNAGFSETRVVIDAFALKAVNAEIQDESDVDVRLTLYVRRNKILDAYLPVAQRIEASTAYGDALKDYIAQVSEQGMIAASHSNSISAFAEATLQFDSVTGVFQNQDLRNGVLGVLAKKKGQAYADRAQERLAKADNVLGVVNSLR